MEWKFTWLSQMNFDVLIFPTRTETAAYKLMLSSRRSTLFIIPLHILQMLKPVIDTAVQMLCRYWPLTRGLRLLNSICNLCLLDCMNGLISIRKLCSVPCAHVAEGHQDWSRAVSPWALGINGKKDRWFRWILRCKLTGRPFKRLSNTVCCCTNNEVTSLYKIATGKARIMLVM